MMANTLFLAQEIKPLKFGEKKKDKYARKI
jgi:hypothetical protein